MHYRSTVGDVRGAGAPRPADTATKGGGATQTEAEAEDETGRRADGQIRAAHAAQRDGRTQPAAPAHDDGKAEVVEVGGWGGRPWCSRDLGLV